MDTDEEVETTACGIIDDGDNSDNDSGEGSGKVGEYHGGENDISSGGGLR